MSVNNNFCLVLKMHTNQTNETFKTIVTTHPPSKLGPPEGELTQSVKRSWSGPSLAREGFIFFH